MGKFSLLLIDDEPELVELLSFFLERQFDVTTCTCPKQALQTLEQTNYDFDVVITDLKMPGLGGDEIAQQIHKHKPETAIVIISGHAVEDGELADLKGLNNISFVMKPFSAHDLVKKIEGLTAAPVMAEAA